MSKSDRLVKVAELCNILGESRTTVWRKIKTGQLPKPFRMKGDSPNSPSRWWLSDVQKAIGAEDRQL